MRAGGRPPLPLPLPFPLPLSTWMGAGHVVIDHVSFRRVVGCPFITVGLSVTTLVPDGGIVCQKK
jgi:hypothetical protein